jgi:hypothetical protein
MRAEARIHGTTVRALDADVRRDTRLRLAHLLDTVAIEPETMPPSAVLFVRRLDDPLPRRLSAARALAPPPREWARAMRASLSECYRDAARPAFDAVPLGANAVVFADRAELLACLARDLVAGQARARWWWAPLLRAMPVAGADALAAAWARDAAFIPATLTHLMKWGRAAEVVRTLTPEQALGLLHGVAHAFRAPWLAPPRAPPPVTTGIEGTRTSAPRRTRTEAPWSAHVGYGVVPESLGLERQALLGVSLVLHGAVTVARSAEFGRAVQAWWQVPGVAEMPSVSRREASDSVARDSDDARAISVSREAVEEAETHVPHSAGTQKTSSASPALRRMDTVAVPDTGRLHHDGPGAARTASVRAPHALSTRLHDPLSSAAPDGVATELGGVFFLVNLLRSLDLRRQLDQHFLVGREIGDWAWIELLGRCLLGRDDVHLAHDPIWRALAALDGRQQGEAAGARFAGCARYSLPSSWLSLTDGQPAAVAWCIHARRLEVWDPRGFVLQSDALYGAASRATVERTLAHVAPGTRAYPLALAERRRLADIRAARPLGARVGRPLRRFLELLLPFVRWRLTAALGFDISDARATIDHALRRRGRVYVTATHVDIVMELGQVALPVRRAGLDFDPGWVPELARVVGFRFV